MPRNNIDELFAKMQKHNDRVHINNFFSMHLGMSYDEYEAIQPAKKIFLCELHFETYEDGEKCIKCKHNLLT